MPFFTKLHVIKICLKYGCTALGLLLCYLTCAERFYIFERVLLLMMYGQKVFVACSAIMLALFISQGAGIKCYQCTTSSLAPTAGCTTSDLDQSFSIICDYQNFCSTRTTYKTVSGVVSTSIERGCASSPDNGCYFEREGTQYRSTCFTDNCNTETHDDTGIRCFNFSETGGGSADQCYQCITPLFWT
ncbi:uncharacterized protein LOC100184972 [Ciona intestinalis]